MTALRIELPSEVYERLATTAQQQQKPIEELAGEWLTERSTVAPPSVATPNNERERVRAALRAAGLLVEPSPEAVQKKPLTPEERARLAAQVPPGRPLSEIIIEERGEF